MERYYSYNKFLRERFGEKVYKLSLSISDTCPNRDGALSKGGCIFCAGGSGEFAAQIKKSVHEQIVEAKQKLQKKSCGRKFIAYFQSYTSTYISPEKLRRHLDSALSEPDIVGISIATRADCLGDDILSVLSDFSRRTFLTV